MRLIVRWWVVARIGRMTMDYSEGIPPCVRIILAERIEPADSERFRGWYHRLAPELRRQGSWTLDNFSYLEDGDDLPGLPCLRITASGALDPLSRTGSCARPACRQAAADVFARTVGLYADVITLADTLTPSFALEEELADFDLQYLAGVVAGLQRLEPLISSGVIRFRLGAGRFCKSCYREFDQRVKAATDTLISQALPEVQFEHSDGFLIMHAGTLLDEPLVAAHQMTRRQLELIESGEPLAELGRTAFSRILSGHLAETFLAAYSAAKLNAPLFSASRLDMLALRALDCSAIPLAHVEGWERSRSIELPWVSELSPQQVVRLRQEASQALPRFREEFARVLARPATGDHAAAVPIDELRAGAARVAAELGGLKLQQEALFRNVSGLLGITVAIYGVASGTIPAGAAMGGLVSLLFLLHGPAREDAREESRLRSSPAYVLVRAQELLRHEHGGSG